MPIDELCLLLDTAMESITFLKTYANGVPEDWSCSQAVMDPAGIKLCYLIILLRLQLFATKSYCVIDVFNYF